MKYLVLIGDGMSDLPLKELGGKTPLEVAKTPNLDYLAAHGLCGWAKNVPAGLEPGSDVAAMSIFGYNPKKYYTGRGPLEAASLGIKVNPGEVVFRCNLVTVKNGLMKDFTADHISTSEAKKIFKLLNKQLGSKELRFYPGLSYRNLLVIKSSQPRRLAAVKTVPPHDITNRAISSYLPKAREGTALVRLMSEAEVLIHSLKTKATLIWPWGQGVLPKMPSFKSRFGKQAAVITAVHLLKGLGKIVGMRIINVPGVTGYLDTNYQGKADYALKALKNNDVVFVHVEAPDEAGHEGNVKHKIKAIEDFDKYVIGTILKAGQRAMGASLRLLVLPDHPTPIKYMTHTSDAVPFVIYPGKPTTQIKGYNEREVRKSQFKISSGDQLLNLLFGLA